MYKVEIKFDTRNLTKSDIDRICEETDQIFENEDLSCADRQPGKRIYLDRGRKQDYGRFWAAIFAIKNSSQISDHLQECFWYNGDEKENLITDFIRN
ncbi:Uncharacterised protein [uncultured Roseburia sp.]|uniref:Uncharacterized protein n=1 Tax=Brotonthovivens ammoniilytica TaxID=2981725 RepID=A0ABT2TLB7_9FIRM|nr:hypothetical protein [Brotonthovivens ammoniilytica]MCU6763000.1 hypothetical protein [Brotonthovivens ammoniilytica]SCJ00008.1 Uncharacterised protein [uncultured Roseburia sp.]